MNQHYQAAWEAADTADLCVRRVFEDGLTVTPGVEKLFDKAGELTENGWNITCARCGQCAVLMAGKETIVGADCTTA